jgi:molybdenum cofactor guanylyltransferase
MKIAGIILAGGKSSRYGKPKMFEVFKDQCFYEYSVAALKDNHLAPIVIATNEHLFPYFKRDDVDFIIEDKTYRGPLFAMYHALSSIQDADWFFVLSCDIPFVTSNFVKKMISFTKEETYDAIIPIQAGRIHPLMALYHRRSLVPMKQLINKNEKKVRLLLDEIRVQTVSFSAEDQVFLNINHQEDWLMHTHSSQQTKEEKNE